MCGGAVFFFMQFRPALLPCPPRALAHREFVSDTDIWERSGFPSLEFLIPPFRNCLAQPLNSAPAANAHL
jgi:hypothetical protein